MSNKHDMVANSAFHEGEIALQKAVGAHEKLAEISKRVHRNFMPDQHREFFATLPMVHLCAVDQSGHPWAFTRTGAPGFVSSPDPKRLVIRSIPLLGEPTDMQLSVGDKISLVGVEFPTLRRNRLNATLVEATHEKLVLGVDQSFGNCPKYINKRITDLIDTSPNPKVDVHDAIDDQDRDIIERCDTMFVASRAKLLSDDPKAGVDINHRGGAAGFVSLLDNNVIEWPDYVGNNFFNTMGNLSQDPRVSVQMIDFNSNQLLNLQGMATLLTLDEGNQQRPDTGRRIRVKVHTSVRSEGVFPFKSSNMEYSIYL